MASSSKSSVELVLAPENVLRVGALASGILIVLGIGTILLRFQFGVQSGFGLISRFDLDSELNVPTWLSSLLLLSAACLLVLVGFARRGTGDPFTIHWFVLGAVFIPLSIDETAALHNLLTRPVRAALNLPPFLTFAWVIPAGALLLMLAAAYSRLFWSLPARTRGFFLGAFTLYVGGAIGLEMAGAAIQAHYGRGSGFAWMALFEESAEMAGMVLFNYAVADYLRARNVSFTFTFGKPRAQPELAVKS